MNVPNYKIERMQAPSRTGYLPYTFDTVMWLDTLLNEYVFFIEFSAPEKAKKLRLKNVILTPVVKNSITGNLILPASYESWIEINTLNGALLTGNKKSVLISSFGCNAASGNFLHCGKGGNLYFDTEIDLNILPLQPAFHIDCFFRINTPTAVEYTIEYRIQMIGDYSIY